MVLWTYPVAARLGLAQGDLLMEVGYGDDVDTQLRSEIEKITGNSLLPSDAQEVVDGVIMWWRDGDGDLVDDLVDALTYLTENGPIWLLTPKMGRPGHVQPSDIQDAAPTAGLSQTQTLSIAADWTATRLVARKAGKR